MSILSIEIGTSSHPNRVLFWLQCDRNHLTLKLSSPTTLTHINHPKRRDHAIYQHAITPKSLAINDIKFTGVICLISTLSLSTHHSSLSSAPHERLPPQPPDFLPSRRTVYSIRIDSNCHSSRRNPQSFPHGFVAVWLSFARAVRSNL